jgi:hypothetical protein
MKKCGFMILHDDRQQLAAYDEISESDSDDVQQYSSVLTGIIWALALWSVVDVVSELAQLTKRSGFVEFIQFKCVFPLRNNGVVAQMAQASTACHILGTGCGCILKSGEGRILLRFLVYEIGVVTLW